MLQQHREEYTVDKNRTDIDYLKKIQQILSNNNAGTVAIILRINM